MPLWIRVASLAFGCHRRNGHATFKTGEIAEILGTPGTPLSASSVSNAIKLAKNAGWIADQSNARCLMVPPHAVTGGLGHPNDRCPVHGAAVTELHAAREQNAVIVHVSREHISRDT